MIALGSNVSLAVLLLTFIGGALYGALICVMAIRRAIARGKTPRWLYKAAPISPEDAAG